METGSTSGDETEVDESKSVIKLMWSSAALCATSTTTLAASSSWRVFKSRILQPTENHNDMILYWRMSPYMRPSQKKETDGLPSSDELEPNISKFILS